MPVLKDLHVHGQLGGRVLVGLWWFEAEIPRHSAPPNRLRYR